MHAHLAINAICILLHFIITLSYYISVLKLVVQWTDYFLMLNFIDFS